MIALLDLIEEHGPAFEYDLMRCGSRLRDFPDNGVSWRDLLILVEQGQKDTSSALWRSLNPDWQWGTAEMLQALLVDEIRYLQYVTLAVAGDKTAKPPKPIPRPGVKDDMVRHGDKAASLPIDEMADWLGGPFAALNN